MVEPQPSSGGAEARAWPMDPAAASSQQPEHQCEVVLTPSAEESFLGREQRRQERYPVQASRPIAARLLDDGGQAQGRWFLADILDISCGGLCLLVSGPMPLATEQRLQLDVRCHPDFGQLRLECVVRWCRSSVGFTTLGLAFDRPMPRLPRLELERRSVRRDPNDEPWALE